MAAKPRSPTYFPDVAGCLSGSSLVRSWDDLFRSLFSHDLAEAQEACEILSEKAPSDILSRPFPSLPTPNQSSKTAFDTAVSSIPESPDGLYVRDDLKEDALWLSRQVHISEQEALRLALLEWEQRPVSRLRQGYSEAEVASLKEALGIDYVERYVRGNGGSLVTDESAFESQDSRRARLLRTHLDQQVSMLHMAKKLRDVSCLPEDKQGNNASLLATRTHDRHQNLRDSIDAGIGRIRKIVQSLESGPSWEIERSTLENLRDNHDTACLRMIEAALDILFLIVAKQQPKAGTESIHAWLDLMTSVAHFRSITSEIDVQVAAIRNIQSTASLLTLSLLDVGATITALSKTAVSEHEISSVSNHAYYFDHETFTRLHETLWNEVARGNEQVGPAALAWAVILNHMKQLAAAITEKRESQHVQRTLEAAAAPDAPASGRRTSGNSSAFHFTIFEELLDTIVLHNSNDDPSTILLDAAFQNCNVVDYLSFLSVSTGVFTTMLPIYKHQALQELIAVAQSFLGYTPELVSAQLSLLTVNPDSASMSNLYDPATAFIEDNDLLRGFYDTSAARFPFESLPFLRFSQALAHAAIFSDDGTQYVEYRLRTLTSFTQSVIKGISIRTTREDEMGSFVTLNKSVNLLDLTQSKLLNYAHQQSETTSIIPTDAAGEIISDPDGAGPKVVRWQHEFSGLAYLGQLLELHYMGLLTASMSPHEDAESVVSEIIELLTTLMTTITNKNPQETTAEVRRHCSSLLQEVGSNLNPEASVTTYIFDILEQALQSFRRRTTAVFDGRVMTACLNFICALAKVSPSSIWSNLNRTSLLGHQSASSPILSIVAAVETPSQEFDFLEMVTELYRALVNIALESGQAKPSKEPASARVMLPAAWRTQSPMLTTATEIMYQTLQGTLQWSFRTSHQQCRIIANIADSFSAIIHYAFGVGGVQQSPSRVSEPFIAAATYLLAAFRTSVQQDIALDPIARLLFILGSAEHCGTTKMDDVPQHAQSVLLLATTLIRCGQMQKSSLSSLEMNILAMVPSLLRIIATWPALRTLCLGLVRSALDFVEPHRPSSLLGYLGSSSCIDLLNLLGQLELKNKCPEERNEMWKLLSSLVMDSQQWLAMVILTGSVPDSSKQPASSSKPQKTVRGKTFLQTAVHELKSIETLPRTVAIAMLEFLLQAQQNWSWVSNDLSSPKDFLLGIVQFVIAGSGPRPTETSLAERNLIAARVTDIATTQLHHAKASRDLNAIKTYIPLVEWLASHAVQVSSYNASLHTNLRRNFAAKYGGLTVTDIQSTGLNERDYGTNFFYDTDFANKLLGHDSSWQGGQASSIDQSFAAEFGRANANLALVDSELVLLASFQRLCIDHCKFFVQDKEIQKAMARIIRHCLQSNSTTYPAEVIFESLFQTRADLSTALLRELVSVGARGPDFLGLLQHAWTATRFRHGSFEQAIINDDLIYWRSILSILLMALTFHVNKTRKATKDFDHSTPTPHFNTLIPIFLEIADRIVAEGFRSVVVALQDQKESKAHLNDGENNDLVGRHDVSLLLTLLQTILRLPDISQFTAELSDRLSASGLVSSCLVLFSWSQSLDGSSSDNQPRYAEYCVQMLVSMSSLPVVAEELAVEGVLSRILSTRTTEALRAVPGGVSHTEDRPNRAFLYRVWTNGLLPLCLNLLHAIGGAMAPEISDFLNQFTAQLSRASTSFMQTPQAKAAGSDVLTLNVAREAASLALIRHGLATYRRAGASAAVDPTTVLPLRGYEEQRTAMVEDLRDLLAMQSTSRRKITIPTNEKELSWQNAKEGDKLDARIVKDFKIAVAALSSRNEAEEEETQ